MNIDKYIYKLEHANSIMKNIITNNEKLIKQLEDKLFVDINKNEIKQYKQYVNQLQNVIYSTDTYYLKYLHKK